METFTKQELQTISKVVGQNLYWNNYRLENLRSNESPEGYIAKGQEYQAILDKIEPLLR